MPHFNMWVGVHALQCLLLLHPARMGMRRMSRMSSSVRAVGVKKDPKMMGRVSASRGVVQHHPRRGIKLEAACRGRTAVRLKQRSRSWVGGGN